MKKYSRKEKLIVVGIILSIVFGFIILTGTFTSSYHLQDDHEFIKMLHQIKSNGLFSTMFAWVGDSFTLRFRPLYYAIRVPLVSILGLHFKLWYGWKALEICLISFFLYFSCRNMKCNKIWSSIFVFLVLVGGQTAIWYRLGPQEATGLVFLSIALYCMTEYCLYSKKKVYNIIMWIAMILMSFMKESFVLMIPPMVLLKLIFEYYNGDKKVIDTLKQNKILIGFFALLFLIEISIIVFAIGTNSIGYAGFSSDTPTYKYIEGIKHSLLTDALRPVMLMFILASGIVLSNLNGNKKKKNNVALNYVLLFIFSIVFMQLVLHAKSTMFERYIAPMSLAYAFMIAWLAPQFIKNKAPKIIYTILVVLLCFNLSNIAIRGAKDFASNGKNINDYLWFIENNYNKDTKILVAMPGELKYSTNVYLNNKGYKKVYEYNEENNKYKGFEEKYKKDISKISPQIKVVVLTEAYYSYLFEKEFNFDEFKLYNFGNYKLYERQE